MLVSVIPVWAGDNGGSESYWRWFVTDTARTAAAPGQWSGRDWAVAASIGLTAAGLYAYDGEIRQWVQDERTTDGDKVTDYIEPMGNGKYLVPALGAYYGYGYTADDVRSRRAAMLGFEGYVVSGIMVNMLKYATHRHRPNSGDSRNTWDGPSLRSEDLSFPSGHASSAFSVAAVLASEYHESTAVRVTAYGLASLVALSRVYDDKHWASDILVGSAIGYFTGKAIYGWRSEEIGTDVSVTPVSLPGGGAVMLTYRY